MYRGQFISYKDIINTYDSHDSYVVKPKCNGVYVTTKPEKIQPKLEKYLHNKNCDDPAKDFDKLETDKFDITLEGYIII